MGEEEGTPAKDLIWPGTGLCALQMAGTYDYPRSSDKEIGPAKSLDPRDASLKKGQDQTQVCQLQGLYLTSGWVFLNT